MCEYCGAGECASGCPNSEREIYLLCENCGDEIYIGDTFYDLGKIYCEDCVENAKEVAEYEEKEYEEEF